MNFLKLICKAGLFKRLIENRYTPDNLPVNALGLQFKNPTGLAAGFDKNARYLNELETLGFGFIEIGTVTPLAQNGNDKPRLFRLPKDEALINRMGFNNDGVNIIKERLKVWKSKSDSYRIKNQKSKIIIGGNIGKNKLTANEDAWKDYEICFKELFDVVDYFVVNVSSPNTPGLRELQRKDSLRKILMPLQNINQQKPKPKPLLFKISPDINAQEIDELIDLATELNLSGIVVSNTTISRENLKTPMNKINTLGPGGLSGKPLQKTSTDLIKYINNKTINSLPVIASGGIFNSQDALEKIDAGASLVQVWTGFIYEGPSIVKNICNGLTYLRK